MSLFIFFILFHIKSSDNNPQDDDSMLIGPNPVSVSASENAGLYADRRYIQNLLVLLCLLALDPGNDASVCIRLEGDRLVAFFNNNGVVLA